MQGRLTRRMSLGILVLLTVFTVSLLPSAQVQAQKQQTSQSSKLAHIFGLHAEGNLLKNGNGQTVRLLGVNRSGAEYMCVANAGIFDGPSDLASIDAMASWKINTVRVPLNEHCWLGINGVPTEYSGWKYRLAILEYVLKLNSRGIIPILDLHWAAPGTEEARGQKPMPNKDHSIDFWKSVAKFFKHNTSVIFDLYNEPTVTTWDCWSKGSTAANTEPCPDVPYAAASMQELVDAVRSTGAKNALMLSGIGYANWIGYIWDVMPTDPLNNLIVSSHIYNFSGCKDAACFDEFVLEAVKRYPVTFAELGENDCQHAFVDSVMDWADQHGVGYLGWAWNTYDCGSFPSLISDYNGTPTEFGVGFKNRFAQLAGQ